jgi:hypothetical protein
MVGGKLTLNSNHGNLLSPENYVTRKVSLHQERACNIMFCITIHEGI